MNRKISPHMPVITTAAGQAIRCYVLRELDPQHWLLDSPQHGHALIRHEDELHPESFTEG